MKDEDVWHWYGEHKSFTELSFHKGDSREGLWVGLERLPGLPVEISLGLFIHACYVDMSACSNSTVNSLSSCCAFYSRQTLFYISKGFPCKIVKCREWVWCFIYSSSLIVLPIKQQIFKLKIKTCLKHYKNTLWGNPTIRFQQIFVALSLVTLPVKASFSHHTNN